jgi:hypothetical protein
MELNIPKVAYLDIKYDWPSFEGVMNILSLWNELLGLEYCIREAFKKIKASDKRFSDIKEEDLEILVAPFQNNCFRKKITVTAIRKWINWLTNKEIAVWWIIVTLTIALVAWIYVVVKDLTYDDMVQINESNISQELYNKIWDRVKSDLLSDEKFRKELAKSCFPLEEETDYAEIRSPNLQWGEEIVKIDNSNKQKFFELWNVIKKKEIIECAEKREIVYWRITAIDLDARINHLKFKIDGEGEEIIWELVNWDINNYKEYLWKWVTIEWIRFYSEATKPRLKIEKIIEARPPLKEAKNIAFDV